MAVKCASAKRNPGNTKTMLKMLQKKAKRILKLHMGMISNFLVFFSRDSSRMDRDLEMSRWLASRPKSSTDSIDQEHTQRTHEEKSGEDDNQRALVGELLAQVDPGEGEEETLKE